MSDKLDHLKKFKNNALDQEEMRRRRANVTVELRKNKREESLLKRRNVQESEADHLSDNDDDPEVESNQILKSYNLISENSRQEFFSKIVQSARSPDPEERLVTIKSVRKLLSSFKNPPIDELIASGIMPVLVNCLNDDHHSAIQFEVAWALTNIASGYTYQTSAVVKSGAVPILIRLLESNNPHVIEQTVWCLGNIIGDGPELRDYCIALGVVEPLIKLVDPTKPIQLLRNVTWVIVNLCRRKDPSPSIETIVSILPTLKYLITFEDESMLVDTVWSINYLTDIGNDITQIVINHGFVPHLVPLLSHEDSKVQTSALRALGNIVTGTDEQTQTVLDCGALDKFRSLLEKKNDKISKEAVWFLSNITAGNHHQIQSVINHGLVQPIIERLEHGDFSTQREAAWAITNITLSGSAQQIQYLINLNVIPPMCNLLVAQDTQILNVLLDGFYNLLKAFPHEKVIYQIEECGGLDKIEALQNHQNESVYMLAFKIINNFFSDDPEEENNENLVPTTNEKGELQFGLNQNNPNNGNSATFDF